MCKSHIRNFFNNPFKKISIEIANNKTHLIRYLILVGSSLEKPIKLNFQECIG